MSLVHRRSRRTHLVDRSNHRRPQPCRRHPFHPQVSSESEDCASMTVAGHAADSLRLQRTHLPERSALLGMSVREADRSLGLNGAGHGLLDTTHFDTVRFPPPDWALPTFAAAAADGELAYTAYRGSDDVRKICAQLDLRPDGRGRRSVAESRAHRGNPGRAVRCPGRLVDEGDVVVLADPEYLFVERMLQIPWRRGRPPAVRGRADRSRVGPGQAGDSERTRHPAAPDFQSAQPDRRRTRARRPSRGWPASRLGTTSWSSSMRCTADLSTATPRTPTWPPNPAWRNAPSLCWVAPRPSR